MFINNSKTVEKFVNVIDNENDNINILRKFQVFIVIILKYKLKYNLISKTLPIFENRSYYRPLIPCTQSQKKYIIVELMHLSLYRYNLKPIEEILYF